ncbi:MAG: hypothetical protein M1453_06335 [Acidobacteria bacterium]|nr:hypothetical protein [Acidobacteriota bacterium]
MNDNYLWDKSGKPDPEVERLENLLGTLREDLPAPAFEPPVHRFPLRWWQPLPRFAAIAATLLLVVSATLLLRFEQRAFWVVTRVEGAPRVASRPISDHGRLRLGEWLVTDSASRAVIDVGLIGEVEVKPDSRVQLLSANASDHRLALQQGAIFARIWAPPRLFSVQTPSANAIDMGCVYRLEVDAAGASLLHVETGLVTLERNGRESLVPAGAICLTRPGAGPGTPYYEDAPEKLKQTLAQLDSLLGAPQGNDQGSMNVRAGALDTVLAESRKRDALTLWHLLTRVAPEEKNRIYDRMAQLVPPPAGVTREGILSGNVAMRDAWADQLGIGSMTWWRFFWKKTVPLLGK